MSARSFYDLLGLHREADDLSIRRAFKKLSARYAPETNPAVPDAQDLLEEAREAYRVLSNPDLRELYDEFGDRSLKAGFDPVRERERIERQKREEQRRAQAALVSPTAVQRAPGATSTLPDWDLHLAIGPRHARYGGLLVVPVTRPVTCPRCEGSGRRDLPCKRCGGARQVRAHQVTNCAGCNGLGLLGERHWCGRCNGSGRSRAKLCRQCDGGGEVVVRRACRQCSGKGLLVSFFDQPCQACRQTGLDACRRCEGRTTIARAKNLRLYIPRGIDPALTYRYAGAGFSQAAPGDLYVRFTVLARAPRR